MSQMIIMQGEKKGFYICPVCMVKPVDFPLSEEELEAMKKEMFQQFYSYLHAMDAGWAFTQHEDFCPPEKEFVAVCPACAAKVDWVKDKHKQRRSK